MTRELIYQKVITKPFTDYSQYVPIRKWCILHFGPSAIKGVKERPWHGHMESNWDSSGAITIRWYEGKFYFRDRAAATFFALHWA